jgi:hypothetical protein
MGREIPYMTQEIEVGMPPPGRLPEWSKGEVLRTSAVLPRAGSNPAPSIMMARSNFGWNPRSLLRYSSCFVDMCALPVRPWSHQSRCVCHKRTPIHLSCTVTSVHKREVLLKNRQHHHVFSFWRRKALDARGHAETNLK